jgi:hypothetical protein
MTDTPHKVILNCETGEEQIVPLTVEEITELDAQRVMFDEQRVLEEAEAEAKAEAKASALAKLTALGLTEEEAKALAG